MVGTEIVALEEPRAANGHHRLLEGRWFDG
jgi:hypothetical protein